MTNAPVTTLQRLVSGGQTGVDRAALDVAITLGLPHGGWCPKGRRAEDGTIPVQYQLRESTSSDYAFRTEQNVVDSDATLIIYRQRLRGGTALTNRLAKEHSKPLKRVRLDLATDLITVTEWLAEHSVRELNVAGPRESSDPGIYTEAVSFLTRLLQQTSLLPE
ncbi:MAG: putative molybdenum carrier protein [Pirellulaceae bacterium]